MFERFTESARRSLFFARQEASELGSTSIQPGHLLLGLTRSGEGLVADLFAAFNVSVEQVRSAVHERSVRGEQVSPSVEIPFTTAAGRVLQFASEEADMCRHGCVGTEHVLLGLLREADGDAADILRDQGLRLDRVRQKVVELAGERPGEASSPADAGSPPAVTGATLPGANAVDGQFFDEINGLVRQLAAASPRSSEARELASRILAAIEHLKRGLNPEP